MRAHRLVLIARCDVFRRMFLTDCVESRTGNIEVPDVAPHVYQLFLRYLYGDQVKWTTFNSIMPSEMGFFVDNYSFGVCY